MRSRLSKWRRLIVAMPAAIVLGFVFYSVSESFSRAQEDRRIYSYFAEALIEEAEPLSFVTWDYEVPDPDRHSQSARDADLSEYDLIKIGIKISEAWRVFAAALKQGNPILLDQSFASHALARAEYAVEASQESGAQMAIMAYEAKPQFFHLDRTVMQLKGRDVLSARFVLNAQGGLVRLDVSQDEVVTTLIRQTLGWRIVSHVRHASTPLSLSGGEAPIGELPPSGINYYPKETPWTAFWEEFDEAVIAADFDLIQEIGAKSIRIFLPREPFLMPATQAERLAQLEVLLQIASQRGLSVVPTLFDLRPSYEAVNWAYDWLYLRAVLDTLSKHSNIAFIDMKNEADLDYDYAGPGLVQAWLMTMISLARNHAPQFSYTIGWSSAQAAADLLPLVDVVTYHEYAALEGTEDRLAALQNISANKPIVVTEIGHTSWQALPVLGPSSPQKQAKALKARMEALRAADGVFIWTLHDFAALDSRAIGGSPITQAQQRRFGLYDIQGQPKPALQAVQEAFEQL